MYVVEGRVSQAIKKRLEKSSEASEFRLLLMCCCQSFVNDQFELNKQADMLMFILKVAYGLFLCDPKDPFCSNVTSPLQVMWNVIINTSKNTTFTFQSKSLSFTHLFGK